MGRAQRGLCKDQFILVETGQLLIVETSRSVLQLTFVFDLFDRAVPSFLQTVLASHATLVENISLPNMCIMQIYIYIYIHYILSIGYSSCHRVSLPWVPFRGQSKKQLLRDEFSLTHLVTRLWTVPTAGSVRRDQLRQVCWQHWIQWFPAFSVSLLLNAETSASDIRVALKNDCQKNRSGWTKILQISSSLEELVKALFSCTNSHILKNQREFIWIANVLPSDMSLARIALPIVAADLLGGQVKRTSKASNVRSHTDIVPPSFCWETLTHAFYRQHTSY